MVEFAINNSVHASTTHTATFVNGLRHPRLPTHSEYDTNSRGGGICSSKNRSGSCSSRVKVIDDANVADVDQVDIEEDNLINSDNTISNPDEDDLLAVRTRRTATNQSDAAEDLLLARGAIVRFVQDFIANAVDRQKWNTDKHGNANVLLFNVGDLVLLSAVNLPKHVVTNVGSSKLLPKYIVQFRVLRRKCNAYMIELPRTMRTYPTFIVGRLRPYQQHEVSSSGDYNRHA